MHNRLVTNLMLRVLLASIATFVLGSVAQAQIPTAPSTVPVFQLGDAVRITVWNSPEFSGQFEVAEDGTIIHPLYREIVLAGLSLPQAEAEFQRILQRYNAEPQIVVEPLFRIPIAGQVTSPGTYTLPPYATVAQAIVAAGGVTPDAELRRARLLREGREIVADLRSLDNEFASIRIRSGDHIFIDRRTRIWADRIEPTIRTAGSLASLVYLFFRVNDRVN